MLRNQAEIEKFKSCMLDMFCIVIAYAITYQLPSHDLTSYSFFHICIVHVAIYYLGNHYKNFSQNGYLDEIKNVLNYEIQMMISLMVIMFVTKGAFGISRRGLVYYTVSHAILVYILRILVKQCKVKIYSESEKSRKIYLITASEILPDVIEKMKETPAWVGQVTAIALFDSNKAGIEEYEGIPVVAGKENYQEYCKNAVVDEVFVNIPYGFEVNLLEIIGSFESMGIPVSFNLNSLDLEIPSERQLRQIGSFNVITFSSRFYNYSSMILKRIIDICGAVVGLMITAIVSIILIPIIKIESKGPAIFAQERVGKNGRVFKFYKFRSMYADAEERKAELMAQNEMEGLMFKMENDPRITKVGRFIRKTSLDELPQFYNVLRGDMSLVGTRPPTVDEFRQYEAKHKRRLSAKPGITGMWQVSGRSDITDFDEVIRLDVHYIDNWSVWMDIKILVKTVKVIVFGDGAR